MELTLAAEMWSQLSLRQQRWTPTVLPGFFPRLAFSAEASPCQQIADCSCTSVTIEEDYSQKSLAFCFNFALGTLQQENSK